MTDSKENPYQPPERLGNPAPEPAKRGFGGACCLGLVVLLVLAVAIPNILSPRGGGNEAAAIGALRAIREAQVVYKEGDMDGDGTKNYASSLEELINTGPDKQEDLIDEILASGLKQGYRYQLFTCPSSARVEWVVNADPVVPGTTGHRWFAIDAAGVVYLSHEGRVRFRPDGTSKDPVLGN